MRATEPKILEKPSNRGRDLTAATQAILRDYAGSRWPSLNHKGRIARLAGVLGFGHRRVRSLYQNEPGVAMRAEEAARIQALKEEANERADLAFEARIAALEAELAALRAEVAGAALAQGIGTARAARGPSYSGGAGDARRRPDNRD